MVHTEVIDMAIKCTECNNWLELTRDTWLKNVEKVCLAFEDGPNYIKEYTCSTRRFEHWLEDDGLKGCNKTIRVYVSKCEECFEFCDELTRTSDDVLCCDECIEDAKVFVTEEE